MISPRLWVWMMCLMGQTGATPLSDQGSIGNVWFADAGSRIITQSEGDRIKFWDSETGEPVAAEIDQMPGSKDSWSHIDSQRKWFLVGSKETGSRLYDFQTGKALSAMIPAFFTGGEAKAVLSPGGFRLMTFEQEDLARIYDTKTCRKVAEIALSTRKDGGEGGPEGVFEENGKRAWILDNSGVIRCFDTMAWKPVGEAVQHPGEGYLVGLEVSADGRFILASSDVADCGGMGVVCIWDTMTRRLVGKPVERSWGARGSFVDGGKRVRFSFGRGAGYVAQMPSSGIDYCLPMHNDLDGPQVEVADGGRTFVTWGQDAIIAFTDAATGSPRGAYHTLQRIAGVATSPVKDRVIALLEQERAPDNKPSSLAMIRLDRKESAAPGEPLVCSARVTFMNREDLSGFRMRISPDGTRVLLLIHGRIRIFQVADLKELASTAPPLTPQ